MTDVYFNNLNYTLGNEDTTLEVKMVEQLNPTKVFSICGSGGRSLPLAYKGAEELYIVDLSEDQLFLAQLRKETFARLTLDEFLLFWGLPPYGVLDDSVTRKDLFKMLELSDPCREYFLNVFKELRWESLVYLGKWEKTFATLALGLKLIMGKKYDEIFRFNSLEDQIKYYENDFPMGRWKTVLFLLGNKSVFNYLLYKGDFIKKNVKDSHFQYYFNAFDQLFRNVLAKESFFLHLCFFGKVKTQDGNPVECDPEVFQGLKDTFSTGKTNVFFERLDAISCAQRLAGQDIDFFSFSDVPSYFTGEIEQNFLQQIKVCLKKGATVVLRYYLRVCQANETGYKDVTKDYKNLILREKVGMYRIKILQYEGN